MLLFTVVLGASTLKAHSVKESINSSGSHHVIYKDLNYNLYENLINDKKIQDVVIYQENVLIYENQTLNILNFDKNINEYINLESGRYPESNNEIIVSNKTNYKINESIKNYKIVGIYNEFKRTLNLNDYSIITKNNINNNLKVNYLVTFKNSISLYKEIYRKADELGLKYTLGHTGDRVYNQVDENDLLLQSLGHYPNMKMQIGMYSMLLVILLVISLFSSMTIKNAFEISLSERKKYFGILRSIGASKKQIFKIILFETILLGLISIPIGLLLGYGFTNILVHIVNNMMSDINTIDYNIIIYPIYLVLALVFIIITILYSAIKPAKKSSEISPVEVIKENETYYYLKSKENYPIIKKIFGVEGELAYKTIKRNGIRSSVIVNSLIVSIILFITLSTFVNFLRGNWESEEHNKYDITIYTSNTTDDYKFLEEIESIKEIDEIIITKRIHLNFKKDNSVLTNTAVSYYKTNRISSIDLIGINQQKYNEIKEKLNLNEDMPILYNYGTYFENDIAKKDKWFNNKLDKLEICSIVDDYQNNVVYNKECYYTFENFYLLDKNIINFDNYDPFIIVSMEWFDGFTENYIKLYENDFKYQDSKRITIEINAEDFVEVDRKLINIFNKYSELELDNGYFNYPLDNYEENIRLSTIELIINILMIFIIIICLTSIINTMNTNLLLRQTEFAVLRSIGFSKKGINKMLLFESIFLCIKTIILGIPLATLFVAILMYLSKMMTGELFKFPIDAYLISFIGIIIVIFIMNIFSNKKIKNNNIIESIRKNSI